MSQRESTRSLVEGHLDYVIKITRGIARSLPGHVDFEDLVAWGNLGLTQAAERWDPNCGAAFTTFAWYRVRGAIFDGLCQMTGLAPAILKRIKQQALEDAWAEEALRASDGNSGLQALTSSFARAVEGFAIVHFNAGLGQKETSLDEMAVDPRDGAADAEQAEMLAMLKIAREELPEDDRRLLEALYVEGLTTTAYAAYLGVNKSTITRRHARVLDRLREVLLDHEEVEALSAGVRSNGA